MGRIIFVTGTDTGVGKTLLTCLLLTHLRRRGIDAVGLKPFCSGSRADIRNLQRAQGGALDEKDICSFYFSEPVTPLVASRINRKRITLSQAVGVVRERAAVHDRVLVEGAGGLLAPLGDGWTAREWIRRLKAVVVVVAADRLGTLNHTLLTVEALRAAGCGPIRVVLNGIAGGDRSVRTNSRVLKELLPRDWVGRVSWLGPQPCALQSLKRGEEKHKKVLARLLV